MTSDGALQGVGQTAYGVDEQVAVDQVGLWSVRTTIMPLGTS